MTDSSSPGTPAPQPLRGGCGGIIPSCSHVGTPLHFHSSTMSGSASLTKLRSRLSISPRQSSSSSILSSIS
jgi:hypothetical protein